MEFLSKSEISSLPIGSHLFYLEHPEESQILESSDEIYGFDVELLQNDVSPEGDLVMRFRSIEADPDEDGHGLVYLFQGEKEQKVFKEAGSFVYSAFIKS
jgi:hypothetical protein